MDFSHPAAVTPRVAQNPLKQTKTVDHYHRIRNSKIKSLIKVFPANMGQKLRGVSLAAYRSKISKKLSKGSSNRKNKLWSPVPILTRFFSHLPSMKDQSRMRVWQGERKKKMESNLWRYRRSNKKIWQSGVVWLRCHLSYNCNQYTFKKRSGSKRCPWPKRITIYEVYSKFT